ncbi:alpha/beta hydrolase [Streptomyces sp. AV19]|uniref:alpha/beta hydrolase n=1 Tax=Streptomyces sp. AV19 TaxID=2793068 RepID=UPI0018FE0E6D|nr:alpha/beta hydrolase [Streptomyces sp. AV19]MBH1933449.1 alpha/beta hydrolase [Streptomyces sp. AV19]MDG4532098.1 alpha/beta hydrolase [Streptomyces sp. AV19]
MTTVDPEIAALLERCGIDPAGGPPPAAPPAVEEMRAGGRTMSLAVAPRPPLPVGSVEDAVLAGVPVRTYRPPGGETVPTVVFFHGGGFVLGDLDTHDGVCRRLCRDLDAEVVAVDYRLAPEHPYPAAYDDCLAVARQLSDGGGRFGVAGDSAGGNLAAGVALAFRDEGRPLAAQLLAYPATDLRTGRDRHPSRTEHADGPLLTADEIDHVTRLYLADAPDAADHAPASPLLADSLAGVAPAVIGCGETDPLRDETLAYADALAAAGVPVRAHRFPGLIHGFLNFDSHSAAVDAAVAELYADFSALLRSP